MLLGYNTNGWAHHDWRQAIELLAELGYQSVAITIDHGTLNPYGPRLDQEIAQMRDLLSRHNLRSVVETGARYLLDPRLKHEPTLVSADAAGRQRRVAFLKHAVDIARRLDSDCVSLWSGVVRDEADEEKSFHRLSSGLGEVIDYASERHVVLGFEPEPGMFIDTMSRYEELLEKLDDGELRLTLDLGHLHCLGEVPIADQIRRWADRLVNVHIEDMRRGVHEHLMFGEGEIQFGPILAALEEVGYDGGLHVELSRHSHDAPRAARQAMEFLKPLM